MAKASPIKTSFNAGEWDESAMAGRADLAKYANACRKMANFLPMIQGGAYRRPPSRHVTTTKTVADEGARLKEFIFNEEQAYMLEFGDYYIRFFKDVGQIVVDAHTGSLSNGDFSTGGTPPSGWTDESTGTGAVTHDGTNNRATLTGNGSSNTAIIRQDITGTGFSGSEKLSIQFDVVGLPGDTLEAQYYSTTNVAIRDAGVGFHVFGFSPESGPPDGNYKIQFANASTKAIQLDNVVLLDDQPLELRTPYAKADLAGLKFEQSNDVLYITHPNYPTYKLQRWADDEWSLERVLFQDGPFLSIQDEATITPSATTGKGVSLTVGGAQKVVFDANDVGRVIRLKHSSTWGWGVIASVTNGGTTSASATCDVWSAFGGTGASSEWRMGVWGDAPASDTSRLYSPAGGWPSVATFYDDRLCFGGPASYPQRADLSVVGDYENMAPTSTTGTVAADNALAFLLNARQVNAIKGMMDDEKGLLIFTTGGEWPLRPVSANEPMSAEAPPSARRSSAFGAADIQPIKVGRAALFVERGERALRELAYVFEDDGFRSPDLTTLATHISVGGFGEMAYQQNYGSIVWATRSDGTLLGLAYSREQDVVAWTRHVLGGVSDADGTQAKVESVAVKPSSDGTYDETWMIVQRYINGGVTRHIEYLTDRWDGDADALTAAGHLDASLTYSGSAATTLSGLSHLEGETVGVWGNGKDLGSYVVSSGQITGLSESVTVAQVGLAYDDLSDLESLRIEAGAADGTSQGKTKRITKAAVRLSHTGAGRYGPDASSLEPFEDISVGTTFTGDKLVAWPKGYETEGYMLFRPTGPAPMTVLALMPQVVTQDR